MAFLQGRPNYTLFSIQRKLVPVLLANYAVWPIAHLVNFKFIPSSQRILYINVCQVSGSDLWNAFLDLVGSLGTLPSVGPCSHLMHLDKPKGKLRTFCRIQLNLCKYLRLGLDSLLLSLFHRCFGAHICLPARPEQIDSKRLAAKMLLMVKCWHKCWLL